MDVMSDQIQDDVRSALADDPRIPYAKEIAVEADGDTVVLRGTVGNFGEVFDHVATLTGVTGITNHIKVVQVL